MNCYDCARVGQQKPAVAVCAACGAGVCLDCARPGSQTVHRPGGFTPPEMSNIETRVINCRTCADVVRVHRHTATEGLVSP